MALSFNGTSSNLKRTGALVSAYPVALFCWVKTTTAFRGEMIFGVGSTATATDELMLYHDSGDDKMVAFSKDSSQSYKASSTNTASTSWTPLLAVFTSATSRTVYYGAGAKVTDTTAAAVALGSLDRIVVGQRGITDTLHFLGDIAELAIWQGTVPGDTEWASLAAGAAPETILNASLVDSWSLQTQAATQTGTKGNVLTATSTSQAGTHPSVSHGTSAGLSTETDAALALSGKQIRAAGLAAETDTALALVTLAGLPFNTPPYEFGQRTGLDVADFSIYASTAINVSVYAAADVLLASQLFSYTETTGADGRLTRKTHASLTAGSTYIFVAVTTGGAMVAAGRITAT